MEFTAYSVEHEHKVIINVAGGGLGNGNAYANVEVTLRNTLKPKIVYAEYGKNATKTTFEQHILVFDDITYLGNHGFSGDFKICPEEDASEDDIEEWSIWLKVNGFERETY